MPLEMHENMKGINTRKGIFRCKTWNGVPPVTIRCKFKFKLCYVMFQPIIRSQFVTISALVDTGGPTSFLQNVLAIRLRLRYLSSSSTPADIGIWSVFSLFFGNISLSLVLHPPSLFFASFIISVVSLYSLSNLLIDLQYLLIKFK